MLEFFTSDQFQTVFAALNSGFLVTLELFFITLIGALPLGLIISFGSMSRFRPFGLLASQFGITPKGKVAKAVCGFRPIRLVCRVLVWAIRGTPLVLQIIILFYVPGMVGLFTWGGGETARFTAVSVAFVLNYA